MDTNTEVLTMLSQKQRIMAMWAESHGCPWYAEQGKSGLWLSDCCVDDNLYSYCFDVKSVKIHLGY